MLIGCLASLERESWWISGGQRIFEERTVKLVGSSMPGVRLLAEGTQRRPQDPNREAELNSGLAGNHALHEHPVPYIMSYAWI